MADTSISWTDKVWNPTRGCRRISPGCEHCYAERQANRFKGAGNTYDGLVKLTANGPRWTGKGMFVADQLAQPLKWRKPCRIFVDSMSDLFFDAFTNEQIAAVFGVMAAAPQHTFQCLTKRATRMREWFEWAEKHGDGHDLLRFGPSGLLTVAWELIAGNEFDEDSHLPAWLQEESLPTAAVFGTRWPLPNVWIGVSVENQDAADERIPELLQTPAAVRFLSCEPLLGPVDLTAWTPACRCNGYFSRSHNPSRGCPRHQIGLRDHQLHWVIAGCESGPGARPCNVEWLRSLRDQCAAAGVPYFLKQAVEQLRDPPTDVAAARPPVEEGAGSKKKSRGVIELPYLDGVQHAAFPVAPAPPVQEVEA
jgi:protein gp37